MAKISDYPDAVSLIGLYTIGTDDLTRTVKVGLEFLKTAADNANEQAANASSKAANAQNAADKANTSATTADTATGNANAATQAANEATTNATNATFKTDAATDRANTATGNANTAATNANTQATNASNAATTANTAATNADIAREAIQDDLAGKVANASANNFATQQMNGKIQFMGITSSSTADDSFQFLDKNGDVMFSQEDINKIPYLQKKLVPLAKASAATISLDENTYTVISDERTSGINFTMSVYASAGAQYIIETTGVTPVTFSSRDGADWPQFKAKGMAEVIPSVGQKCIYTVVKSTAHFIINAMIYENV